MRHILITITLLLLGLMPMSAQQKPATIEQVSERINAKCPLDISDGMKLTVTQAADSVFTFCYTISDDMFDNISSLGGILHDSMLAEMESSPDPAIKNLLAVCKASGSKIVQRFANSKGDTFDITILPSEI